MSLPPLRDFVRADVDSDGPVVQMETSIVEVVATLVSARQVSARVHDDDRPVGGVSLFDVLGPILVRAGVLRAETAASGDQAAHDASANPAVVLRFRKLGDKQDMLAQFESLADAKTWLTERPKFIRVIRVEEPSLSTADEAELHDAMRPLDDEELDRLAEEQRELQRVHSIELRDLQERAERESAPAPEEEPDEEGAFLVRFVKNEPLRWMAKSDAREIPDQVRSAVTAWVARRNEWMHHRRVHVAVAPLRVAAEVMDAGSDPNVLADYVEPEGKIDTLPGLADDE